MNDALAGLPGRRTRTAAAGGRGKPGRQELGDAGGDHARADGVLVEHAPNRGGIANHRHRRSSARRNSGGADIEVRLRGVAVRAIGASSCLDSFIRRHDVKSEGMFPYETHYVLATDEEVGRLYDLGKSVE